jgi:threonine/homoserine/homoserine lactone efflux protein
MAGIFVVYFAGGIIIQFGLDKLITDFLENYSLVVSVIEIIIGVILLCLGYRYRKHTKPTEPNRPKSLKPSHTFLFGFIVTASDIPTAFPYLAAIGRIIQENPPLITTIFLLSFYTLLYELPLIIILGLYFIKQEKIEGILQRATRVLYRWIGTVIIVFFVLLGLFLIADGIAAILGNPLF